MRAVKSNDSIITHYFYGADEETLTDADASVTVTVAREDGTALTGGTASTATTGVYTFDLTAATHTDEIDDLTVTWSCDIASAAIVETDIVRVVGGRFFGIATLRAQRGMADTAKYTNAELKDVRDVVEDFIEEFTEQAWVTSYARYTTDGDGSDCLFLPDTDTTTLTSVSVGGTAQTISAWTLSASGRIATGGTTFTTDPAGQNVVVKYEYGAPVLPGDLRRASITLARHILLSTESTIPDRARIMQTEWGMFHLDTANEDHPTGLPEVDAVLVRYRAAKSDWVVA